MTGLDFEFGRHAAYIWPAFALTALALLAATADSLLRARRWRRELARLEAEARR